MSRKRFLLSILVLLILALSFTPVHSDDTQYQPNQHSNDQSTNQSESHLIPEFIPTNEWQEILPGQSIPPGLWVRLDITTGKKTARLLEESDSHSNHQNDGNAALVIVDPPSNDTEHLMDEEDTQSINQAELHSTSSHDPSHTDSSEIPLIVPSESVGTLGAGVLNDLMLDYDPSLNATSPSALNSTLLKQIRAERLRELAEHFSPTDDVVVIQHLIQQLIEQASLEHSHTSISSRMPFEHLLQAFDSLETFLHQIDNAVDAVHLGLIDVLTTYIDRTFVTAQSSGVSVARENLRLFELQEKSCLLLGTAAQNNVAVINEAKQEHSIELVVRLLQRYIAHSNEFYASDDESITPSMLIEQSLKTQSKCLFALSSLMRAQPESQQVFLSEQGDRVIVQLIDQAWSNMQSHTPTSKGAVNVIEKAMSLISSVYDDAFINQAVHPPLFEAMIGQSYCSMYHQFDASRIEHLLQLALSNDQPMNVQLSAWRLIESVLNIQIRLSKQTVCIHRTEAQQGLQTSLQTVTQAFKQTKPNSEEDETRRYWLETVQVQLKSLTQPNPADE